MDAPPYTLEEVRVPMPEAGAGGLQVLLALPNQPRHPPVVLMTHDEIPIEFTRHDLGPGMMMPDARWFVLRGWAVAMVMRRGNGESGGVFDHRILACGSDENENLHRDNAKDLRVTATYLAKRTDLDTTRMLAVGYHMGGAAAMWLAEGDRLPSLRAVISFSLGWDHIPLYVKTCIQVGVEPMFADLGSKTKTPMMWVLRSKGDPGGHEEEVAALGAFRGAGGSAEVIWLKAPEPHIGAQFASDAKEWTPALETFLMDHDLPYKAVLTFHPPVITHVPLSDPSRDEYLEAFLLAGPNKALAIAQNGYFSYATGMASLKLAKERALDRCRKLDCKVVIFAGR